MTRRLSLTPKQRLDMHGAQQGKCAKCGAPTPLDACIAEHTRPVAQGNTDKPDCLLCIPCAHRKSYGTKATTYGSDAHETAKMKRILAKRNGAKKRKTKPIPSRGFQGHRLFDGTPVWRET